VIANGTVMARTGDTSLQAVVLTRHATAIMVVTRVNPAWMLLASASLCGFGLPQKRLRAMPSLVRIQLLGRPFRNFFEASRRGQT
jgi:hypothetical protein